MLAASEKRKGKKKGKTKNAVGAVKKAALQTIFCVPKNRDKKEKRNVAVLFRLREREGEKKRKKELCAGEGTNRKKIGTHSLPEATTPLNSLVEKKNRELRPTTPGKRGKKEKSERRGAGYVA